MNKIKVLTLKAPSAKLLRQLHKPPSELYIKGAYSPDKPSLAVVGSRKPTSYGRKVVDSLVSGLRGYEVQIVSGLALGVDMLSHQAALTNNLQACAVLPCGIDTVYPRSHAGLAQSILRAGGSLVSEYSGDTTPKRHSFIERNRIIAALSDAVLIPEAALKSGSMHTANFALELGLTVLAVPGPIDSSLSQGTNTLISKGATPVLSAEDILEALSIAGEPKQTKLMFDSPQQQQIYAYLKDSGSSDTGILVKNLGLPASEVQSALSLLELEGTIACSAGQWYLK